MLRRAVLHRDSLAKFVEDAEHLARLLDALILPRIHRANASRHAGCERIKAVGQSGQQCLTTLRSVDDAVEQLDRLQPLVVFLRLLGSRSVGIEVLVGRQNVLEKNRQHRCHQLLVALLEGALQ